MIHQVQALVFIFGLWTQSDGELDQVSDQESHDEGAARYQHDGLQLLQPLPALELASRQEAAIMRLTRQAFGLLGLIKSGNVF